MTRGYAASCHGAHRLFLPDTGQSTSESRRSVRLRSELGGEDIAVLSWRVLVGSRLKTALTAVVCVKDKELGTFCGNLITHNASSCFITCYSADYRSRDHILVVTDGSRLISYYCHCLNASFTSYPHHHLLTHPDSSQWLWRSLLLRLLRHPPRLLPHPSLHPHRGLHPYSRP
jgi:hypothetical protein